MIISAPYKDLLQAANAGQLDAGQKYRLTDYQTMYIQPGTNKEIICDKTEPLLLTAVSEYTFDVSVFSCENPLDYIEYDFFDNEFSGTSLRPGFIQRRISKKQNISAPFDWRNIKWARFRADFTDVPVYQKGKKDLVNAGDLRVVNKNICVALHTMDLKELVDEKDAFTVLVPDALNNYCLSGELGPLKPNFDDYQEFYTFDLNGKEASKYCFNIEIGTGNVVDRISGKPSLSNNVFKTTTYEGCPHDIWSADSFLDNTFHDGCYNNSFEHGFINNLLLGENDHLSIGQNCYKNIFNKYCTSIAMKAKCFLNFFGERNFGIEMLSNVYQNIMGYYCSVNYFKDYIHDNFFGCQVNGSFFGPHFFGNSLGNYCSRNSFVSHNSHCKFAVGMHGVTLTADVQEKDFSKTADLYIADETEQKAVTISRGQNNTNILSFFDAEGKLISKVI